MAIAVSGRPMASFLLPLLALLVRSEQGVDDATQLIQLQEGASITAAHAEAAADMIKGAMTVMRGAFHGDGKHNSLIPRKEASIMSGVAGCSWPKDLQASWKHMSKLFPTVEHGVLSIVMPKLIERAKKKEAGEAVSEEDAMASTAAMQTQLFQLVTPLKGDLVPPECNKKLIKSKIMAQSLTGGDAAGEIAAKCLLEATHVTPGCARCAGQWLNGFMGKGMMGLANSCVPKCAPANDACKKGMAEQCVSKSYPCLKCMKPGLLEFADCVGINSTRFQLANKLDLYAKAFRDGSTEGEGLERLIDGIVLATNA
mmetsp:Transcript_72047/g.224681  ORF Transcript_72047/g.224681 Transcript_72047/m.224681 type:complete len:313 (-) Transcript_72047:100-1038(-)